LTERLTEDEAAEVVAEMLDLLGVLGGIVVQKGECGEVPAFRLAIARPASKRFSKRKMHRPFLGSHAGANPATNE